MPSEIDNDQVKNVKAFFNDPPSQILKEVEKMDESFYNVYWINPKTILWFMVINEIQGIDYISYMKDKVSLLVTDQSVPTTYFLYYKNFLDLLLANV